jgi:DNA adenine methylase
MTGPLAYIGGKNRLADKIISLFPKHLTYVEPFAGGAQVLFHKQPSDVEVLNDLDGEIVNFFRVCQSHHQELVRYLHFVVVSRQWYETLANTPPESLTDIQRAARFFYLQKNSFGGLVVRQNYAGHVIQRPSYSSARVSELIQETHERLANVQIERLPYEQILTKYDRPTTLFYLDPPYYERRLYRFNFEPKDFTDMADRLRRIKGKFILSLNDVPETRRLLPEFTVRHVTLSYTAQKKVGKRYRELLITNF